MGITKPALLLTAGMCLAWAAAQTQPAKPARDSRQQAHHAAPAGSAPAECKEMMAKHQQMMAGMKAMDSRLDQKLAAMNAATGQAKVNAMAEVINEMVKQRRDRQEKMMAMHSGMMSHMAGHMAPARSGSSGQARTNCPMMQAPTTQRTD